MKARGGTYNYHSGHRSRVRQRYRTQGIEGFADHELLELLLYYCYPRCDTNEIAHRMIKEFGSFHNLLEADVETLMSVLNCSENIAIFLNMLPMVANRYRVSRWGKKIILDSLNRAANYACDLLIGYAVERFYLLCLDTNFKLINAAFVAEGSINAVPTPERRVAEIAARNHSVNVIMVHNHPGGTQRPSPSDRIFTGKAQNALGALGMYLTDHIIVAGDNYYSFSINEGNKAVRGYI